MSRVRPTISELTAQGKWMTPEDLLKVVTSARQDVLDEIHDDGIYPDTARRLHDVTLACTIFGYLPPTRLACLSSLLHPSYDGPCLYPACNTSGCQGNKLLLLGEDPLRVVFSLPHHKNTNAWGATIHFEAPAELAELLHMWATQGHDELCQHTFLIGSPPTPTLFMTPSGKAINSSSMQYFWHTWLGKNGGVGKMPPSMCRHIFVSERRSDDRVDGPSDRGAAMAMGNSLDAWDRYYEKQRHFHPADCQRAVNAMDTWREGLLKSQAAKRGKPTCCLLAHHKSHTAIVLVLVQRPR